MRKQTLCTALTATLVAAAPALATAQSDTEGYDKDRAQKWSQMRSEAIPASEMLRGNVTNGLNAFAQVRHLIVDKGLSEIQYVLIEAPMMPWDFYVEDGFVSFERVEPESGAFGTIDLRIEGKAEPQAPSELEITANEAEYRLATRIIDSRLEVDGENFYQIEDLLVHPETGDVTHVVIGTAENTLFSNDRRTVPASAVAFENGEFRTDLSYERIEARQPYDPGFL